MGFSNAEMSGVFRPVEQTDTHDTSDNGKPPKRTVGAQNFMDAPAYRPDTSEPRENHKTGETFARVYVNEIGKPAMSKGKTGFPAGSIIVREKLWRAESAEPALVTAMFKRERGFSPETNDWEFFVIDRGLTRIKDRDTVGNCASCHINAKDTDWVFKTYLP